MDNTNVIRVGFITPALKIADTNGDIDDPINRTGKVFTLLSFINNDDKSGEFIKAMDSGIPKTEGGFEVIHSAIAPVKVKLGRAFKEKAGFKTRLFCDNDLRFGKAYSIVDSGQAKPSYHPTVFVIGEDGTVRYRQKIDLTAADGEQIRQVISQLI